MKRIIAVLVLIVAGFAAYAQNSIKVQVPNVVAVDEQFNVTFIIEGENSPSDFSWNPGDEFQLVWGPQRGSSSSITIINGKRTKSSQSTFTYVLMPRAAGTFNLPEAAATVKGTSIKSPKTSIEVVSSGANANSSPRNSASSGNSGASSSSTGEIESEDLFLRLSLSRSSVVVGEPITATLKIFQRVNIAGFEDAKFPTFNGFWSQEVAAPTNIEFKRESYNDMIFNTAVLRSWVIIPQQAGEITIDPAELVCLVNIRNANMTGSIFDSFFQDDYRTIRKRIYSQSYKVKVSPLPAGAPASFGGGVGKFNITSSLSKDSLKTHEAASLKITVSGNGNVSLLEAPKVNFPPDFEVYDVKAVENTDKSNGKTSGSKTFEYPFIPRSHGDFVLDPVEYSYFDVNSHKYVTLATEPLAIEVLKGAETSQSTPSGPVSSISRKDVKDLGSDIRFIKTGLPRFTSGQAFFFGSPAFWALTLVLIALAVMVYFALRRLEARKADVAGSKNRKASKMALKRLSQAGDFLDKNLYTAFYEELHRALMGYVSDKLNMDIAEMSKDNIAAALSTHGVGESVASQFTGLLDACEFARYAPDAGHDAMDTHYKSAVDVISSIDSSMKSNNSRSGAGAAVLALLLLLSPSMLRAEQKDYPDSLWSAGVEAYNNSQWSEALDAWEGITAVGFESSELYYNLGNAYFRQENYSKAILNYERALRLNPSDADIKHNLEFANEFIQDRIDAVPELFLKSLGRKMCGIMTSNAWTALFIVFLVATLALALVFLLCSGGKRKLGFYAGIVALVLTLLCFFFARSQRVSALKDNAAIIMRAVSSVKSSPSSDSATDLFILHEGTKVKVLDSVGDWNNIELLDGRQGWIKASDVELI